MYFFIVWEMAMISLYSSTDTLLVLLMAAHFVLCESWSESLYIMQTLFSPLAGRCQDQLTDWQSVRKWFALGLTLFEVKNKLYPNALFIFVIHERWIRPSVLLSQELYLQLNISLKNIQSTLWEGQVHVKIKETAKITAFRDVTPYSLVDKW